MGGINMEHICQTCGSKIESGRVCPICGEGYKHFKKNTLIDTKSVLPILRDRGFEQLKAKDFNGAEPIFKRMQELDSDNFFANLGLGIVTVDKYIKDPNNHTLLSRTNQQWTKTAKLTYKVTPDEKTLIKKYCSHITVGNEMNVFLYIVLSCGSLLLQLFLDCGFDPNQTYDLDNHKSALYLAANIKFIRYIEDDIKKINMLLEYGADPYVLTDEGEGVINSNTRSEFAQAIRRKFPNIKCADKSKQKNDSKSKFQPASGHVRTNNNTFHGKTMSLGNKAILLMFLIMMFIGWIITSFQSCSTETSATSQSSSSDTKIVNGYTYVRCYNYCHTGSKKCYNYVIPNKWNKGYCSSCHHGSHKCAEPGCDAMIEDYRDVEYCSYHTVYHKK